MIFVTVGTQLAFDRLIQCVDDWAGRAGRSDVFAQAGPTDYRARHIQLAPFISADEFRSRVERAEVVIAHAGMGSIITALELGKPIIVMPRRADLGEHRNDHQLATAKRFLAQGRIAVAFDEKELADRLDQLSALQAGQRITAAASDSLLASVRAFIEGRSLNSEALSGRNDGPATLDGRPDAEGSAARAE